jgi:hypothetical protein
MKHSVHNIAVLNQKIKRQTETIVRLKDEIRSLNAVKKETSNKYMSVEAGVQCNTLKIYVGGFV